MGQFFKYLLASILGSMLGLFLALFVFFFVAIGMTTAMISGLAEDKDVKVEPNSILNVDLAYVIPERSSEDPFANFNINTLEVETQLGLNDILASIESAKSDDDIKGIYIDVSILPSGMATVEAIRQQLIDFKESGKFIVAYGEIIGQKAYYLASVADEIYVNPVGYMELKGFNTQLAFLKNMMEKLGVEAQVFYAGKYKSATEPFRLTEMSEANEEQVMELLNGFYSLFLNNITAQRNMDVALLDSICDNLLVREPADALKFGLVEGTKYYDEVLDILADKVAAEKTADLEFLSLEKYNKARDKNIDFKVKDKIAILYASGNIVDGDGEETNIGSARFAKALREIREDDKIKACVIRINSGGGSALASDIILREVTLVKEKMPVIVSMGDVAASGGYYIACEGDTILAEPNTVTGSIGVFGIIPNMQTFFNEKLGVTFDGVETGKYGSMGSVTRPVTEGERAIIQAGVDSVYATFKNRVAAGRDMSVDYVDSIAQGRVYTGEQALKIGLVDALGGMDDALAFAKEKAGLEAYRIAAYPKQKNPFEKFMKDLEADIETRFLKYRLGEYYGIFEKIEEVKNNKGVMAKMPYDLLIE